MLLAMGSHYWTDGRSHPDDESWRGVPVPRDVDRVLSPGGWDVPAHRLAAWDWLPDGGGAPRLDLAPWWLRCWYRTPLVDRWAHACLWRRGCWEVLPCPDGPAGVPAPAPVRPVVPEFPAVATING